MSQQHDSYFLFCDLRRRKGPSSYLKGPPALAGLLILIVLFALVQMTGLLPHPIAWAALAPNPNCTLMMPAAPLSAQGLATPYRLRATDPALGPCHEANARTAAFVQGAVLDPASGTISIYDPLVIDDGAQPASPPVLPHLPTQGIVAIWFGFNGTTLTLQSTDATLAQNHCVRGKDTMTPFSQFAYCNAEAFFAAATIAIGAGLLQPPALGVAKDGLPCPSVRDFSVVDADQSDNVTTQYLVTKPGQMAQVTADTLTSFPQAAVQVNGSDNRLLDSSIDQALGCVPWVAPNLANPGEWVPALPLNELQAAFSQMAPVALVPVGDPMVVVNGKADMAQLNAYRRGVDQTHVATLDEASTTTYCQHLLAVAPARLLQDAPFTRFFPSPDVTLANSLLTFLAQRFVATIGPQGLNCIGLLKTPSPLTLQMDKNGVAVAVMFASLQNKGGDTSLSQGTQQRPDQQQVPMSSTSMAKPGAASTCSIKGTSLPNCVGMVVINGQTCLLMQNTQTLQISLACSEENTWPQSFLQQSQPQSNPDQKATPPPSLTPSTSESRNLFQYGQCTWWANERYHQLHGVFVPWIYPAHAWQWPDRAREAGWHRSSIPQVGDIIALQPGIQKASSLGHVAIVEQVLPNGHVSTSNMNWAGHGTNIVSVEFAPGPGVVFLHQESS